MYIKYTGRRAGALSKYNNPRLKDGPYDFSSGGCVVSDRDAEVLMRMNRNGMVPAEKPAEKPPEKPAEKPKVQRPAPKAKQ